VIRNALFFGRDKFSDLLIPWATYTEPEVAHVGLYEKDLIDRGIEFTTITRAFDDVDRAIVDGETEGFVKIHVKKGSDQILGATIVGGHAGDMISEITVAMQAGMGLGKLASVIHPYPTAAEAIRQCGDAYNRSRLTPTVKAIFNRLMAFKR
jgi:pyruvate/2-oxoglutarate dehydrogenase complex dihydrolipoamide dehydrogenase (E3) component